MDFLDPRKKRAHSIRLAIGHTLMGLIVVIGTYILVSQAYGFDVDKRTGNVIRNGLVFVDSAPDKANVYVNGVQQRNKTNTRLALPEGQYGLSLKKDGYRDWSRNFEMKGGYVERFNYPMLIPSQLQSTSLQTINKLPSVGLQSPDRRWVLLPSDTTGASIGSFTQYDLNTLKDKKPTTSTVNFPAGLFNPATGEHRITLVEWASDNKNVLIKHEFTGGFEYIVLDRDEPGKSVNVNKQLNTNPDKVSLLDKKPDLLHLYTSAGGVLQKANLKDKKVTPVLTDVTSYKSHGDNVLLYAQAITKELTKNRVFLKDGDKTYNLQDLPISANIPLEIARYDNNWFVAVGSDAEQKTFVYKNPQNYINDNKDKRPGPITILKTTSPISNLAFSQNTQFIMVNSSQHFGVYDAENDRTFAYDLPELFYQSVKPVWMDGHRIIVNTGTQTMIFDYDGQNIQKLMNSDKTLPVFFNRDYTFVYNVAPQTSGFDILQTALRTPEDQ